jgi:uncharacterized repeat protein (TIGR03803 family)
MFGHFRLIGVVASGAMLGAVHQAAAHQAAASETVLHVFRAQQDGAFPWAGLVPDGQGNFYGLAETGGANEFGTVFELTPASGKPYKFRAVYSFTGSLDGAFPEAAPAFDSAGNIYGTTIFGGGYSQGAVFEITPDGHGGWQLAQSYDFTGSTDGGKPAAGVVIGSDGTVYGSTTQGGAGGCGTIYALTPSGNGWAETTIHGFQGTDDGCYPYGQLAIGPNGDLFGTAEYGGAADYGVVFQLHKTAKTWKETVLYAFTGGQDGSLPASSVTFDASGNLYGTTAEYNGGVFRLTPPKQHGGTWGFSSLYTFTGGADGGNPYSGVTIGKNGVLYGATYAGGKPDCQNGVGCGVVYRLTATKSGPWTEKILKTFNGGRDGGNSFAVPVFDAAGNLLGTSYGGGRGVGTVFQLTP